MNKDEASKHFDISTEMLDKYESINNKCYCDLSDKDIEKISTMITLYDIGFSNEEVADFMLVFGKENKSKHECELMLNKKRADSLEEIHNKENEIDRIDYIKTKL